MKTSFSSDVDRKRAHPLRRHILVAFLVLGTLDPAVAGANDRPPAIGAQAPDRSAAAEAETNKLDPMASLRALSAYLTPDDINELTIYLRDVVVDVLRGTQDATLPPDLAFKLAVLEKRFRKEGDVYMQQALRNLDRDIKRFLQGLPVSIQPPELRARNGN